MRLTPPGPLTSSFIQTRIYDDPREIDSIWFPGEDAGGWSITSTSSYACEKIIPYSEPGPSGPMTFFAVYRGGEVYVRVPAHMVFVYYTEAKK